MNNAKRRIVDLEGSQNIRDMGGIAVADGSTRFGLIYRSDRLSNLTPADGETLIGMNIQTIIDMRTGDERTRAPNRLPSGLQSCQTALEFLPRQTPKLFESINSGTFDGAAANAAMLRQYAALTLEHTDDYAAVFKAILTPAAAPLIFHCTSGKDRTGMVAALLLLALGASRDSVVEDYVMTEGNIEKVDLFEAAARADAVDTVMAAKADYIEAALVTMEKSFGSIDNYLSRGVGLDGDKRRRLQDLMLER